MKLEEALDRLPKVELHCHVEGTMRPQTLVELARKNDRTLPAEDPTELYCYTSLDGFLRVFWLVQECLADRDDWARLAYESVVDGAPHGLIYRETFFTPARHLAGGQRLEDIVAGLEEGLEAGESETGARVVLIADMDRAFGGEAGRHMVEELVALRRTGKAERVIGVGMDSTELGVDPAQFLPAYRLAASAGFRLTAHQGENSPPLRSSTTSGSSARSGSTTASPSGRTRRTPRSSPTGASPSRCVPSRTSGSGTCSPRWRSTPGRGCGPSGSTSP